MYFKMSFAEISPIMLTIKLMMLMQMIHMKYQVLFSLKKIKNIYNVICRHFT